MSKFVVDIVLSLTVEELQSLKTLSEKEQSDLPTVARSCMNTKCKERLEALSTAIDTNIEATA